MREVLIDPTNIQPVLVTEAEFDVIESGIRWRFEREVIDPIFFDGAGRRTDEEIKQKQQLIDGLQAIYDTAIPHYLGTHLEISNESSKPNNNWEE